MAGCECEVWERINNPQTEEEREAWPPGTLRWDILDETWVFRDYGIKFCPWCGSKLTEE